MRGIKKIESGLERSNKIERKSEATLYLHHIRGWEGHEKIHEEAGCPIDISTNVV